MATMKTAFEKKQINDSECFAGPCIYSAHGEQPLCISFSPLEAVAFAKLLMAQARKAESLSDSSLSVWCHQNPIKDEKLDEHLLIVVTGWK